MWSDTLPWPMPVQIQKTKCFDIQILDPMALTTKHFGTQAFVTFILLAVFLLINYMYLTSF